MPEPSAWFMLLLGFAGLGLGGRRRNHAVKGISRTGHTGRSVRQVREARCIAAVPLIKDYAYNFQGGNG